MTQIWPEFGHILLYRSSVCFLVPAFLKVRSLLFPETLQLVRTQKGGKNFPSAFLKNPILPILVKNCPKLAIWLDVCNSLFKGRESLKNLKVGVFVTDLKQVPFVLRQTNHTYSESWGPVENLYDPFWTKFT